MSWPRTSYEYFNAKVAALPRYLRDAVRDVMMEFDGWIDRDNIKKATIPSTAIAVGCFNTTAAADPLVTTSSNFLARNGTYLLDESAAASAGVYVSITTGDAVLCVQAAVNVIFDRTGAGTDFGYVSFGIMVDGEVVARSERVGITISTRNGTAFPFYAIGACGVPGGTHKVVCFLEFDEFSGASDLLEVQERTLIVEECAR